MNCLDAKSGFIILGVRVQLGLRSPHSPFLPDRHLRTLASLARTLNMPETFTHKFDTPVFKGETSFNTGLYINGKWVDGGDGGYIE